MDNAIMETSAYLLFFHDLLDLLKNTYMNSLFMALQAYLQRIREYTYSKYNYFSYLQQTIESCISPLLWFRDNIFNVNAIIKKENIN